MAPSPIIEGFAVVSSPLGRSSAISLQQPGTMPIYAYKCESCGHAKDVLQKMSDPLLTQCPVCGAPTFKKQLTAAGFQLKGSGWYVTDFKGGDAAPMGLAPGKATGEESSSKADTKLSDASPAKAAEAGSASKSGDSAPTKSNPASSGASASGGVSSPASGSPSSASATKLTSSSNATPSP